MATSIDEKCVVGIRLPKGGLVKAFDVRIKDEDVYVNYSDSSTTEAHASYHASGQQHIKVNKEYVKWDGGPKGEMEPMKLFRMPPGTLQTRQKIWTVGWEVPQLGSVLPALHSTPDMLVDVQDLNPDAILTFEVGVIGDDAKSRTSIVGFPVIATHRFGSVVHVEIEAFVVSEETVRAPYEFET